jgi:hypothetical protein
MKTKMTNEKKEINEVEKKVANEIQEILESNNYALQPFIQFSEFGLVPRVRLVEVNQTTNGQAKYNGEVKKTEGEDGATKA